MRYRERSRARSSLVEISMPFTFGSMLRKACVFLVALSPLAAHAANDAAPASRHTVAREATRVVPKAYNVGGALAIRDDASYSFQSTSGPVRLDLGRITNESATTTSGAS